MRKPPHKERPRVVVGAVLTHLSLQAHPVQGTDRGAKEPSDDSRPPNLESFEPKTPASCALSESLTHRRGDVGQWLSFCATEFWVVCCTAVACFYVYRTFQEDYNKAINLGCFWTVRQNDLEWRKGCVFTLCFSKLVPFSFFHVHVLSSFSSTHVERKSVRKMGDTRHEPDRQLPPDAHV